jgi:hypothetical protein
MDVGLHQRAADIWLQDAPGPGASWSPVPPELSSALRAALRSCRPAARRPAPASLPPHPPSQYLISATTTKLSACLYALWQKRFTVVATIRRLPAPSANITPCKRLPAAQHRAMSSVQTPAPRKHSLGHSTHQLRTGCQSSGARRWCACPARRRWRTHAARPHPQSTPARAPPHRTPVSSTCSAHHS